LVCRRHVHLYAQVSDFPSHVRVPSIISTGTLLSNSLYRVTSLSFVDESEIVWSKFPDPGWNRWSAYQLRRKWQALKRSVSGHPNLTPRGEYNCDGSTSRFLSPSDQSSCRNCPHCATATAGEAAGLRYGYCGVLIIDGLDHQSMSMYNSSLLYCIGTSALSIVSEVIFSCEPSGDARGRELSPHLKGVPNCRNLQTHVTSISSRWKVRHMLAEDQLQYVVSPLQGD
jgi:hypothetical protein